ncbi:hypothetical protein VE00_09925 [Pseudogymnoascus sp. WSF 3629]|nr:hypothetical protein VE00_09925 [Pseudogymnoascus sp. WSF 3629]
MSKFERYILQSELKPNAQSSDMWTPSSRCRKDHSTSKIRLLLKHGVDPNIPEDESWTSLHPAVDSGDDGIVKILLENGADPKNENIRGDTPMKLARIDRRLDFQERVRSNFRLVDLELGCVKDASLDERYIALSYVCNLPSMFTLRKDNAERMYVEGYLERIRADLLKTINDAIDLVQAVGERYLWVDSLCLIGDNEGDIALGVRIMNSVFQGSYFTIVAASGVDANAGLWGAVGSDAKEKVVQQNPEVGIDLKTRLSKSEYSKRGWTLQELTLSRRALVFIDNRFFFRCQEVNWDQTSSADNLPSLVEGEANESRICGIPDPLDNVSPCLSAYLELFEEYSRRELRYDGDALRGFYGLIRPLFAGMKTPSVEGLPGYYVNAFMLFTSPRANLRRRPDFASFSWTGWAGELKWPRENLIWWLKRNEIAQWNQYRTPIDQGSVVQLRYWRGWHGKEDSHLVKLLSEFPQVFDSETVEFHRMYLHRDYPANSDLHMPSWDEEILKIKNPKASSKTKKPPCCLWATKPINSQSECNRLIKRVDWGRSGSKYREWDRCHKFVLRILQEMHNLEWMKDIRFLGRDWPVALRPNTAVSERIKARRGIDRRALIWEGIMALILRDRNEPQDTPLPEAPKFPDYDVLLSWTISLRLTLAAPKQASNPPRPLHSASGTVVGSLHPDSTSLLPSPPTPIELIVLSRSQTPNANSTLLDIEKERKPSPGQPWDLLWVMHVEWRDGVAERRGVGQVLTGGTLEGALGKVEVKLVVLG